MELLSCFESVDLLVGYSVNCMMKIYWMQEFLFFTQGQFCQISEMILENLVQPDLFSDTSSDCSKFLQHSLLKCHFAGKPATCTAADGSNSW